MYDWFIPLVMGWFGTHWWPGIEVDAPRPSGGGDPWWSRLVWGLVGGLAAVIAARIGLWAASEPMPGLAISLAIGNVTATIGRSLTRQFR